MDPGFRRESDPMAVSSRAGRPPGRWPTRNDACSTACPRQWAGGLTVKHEDGLHKARIGSILARHLFGVPERRGSMGEVIPFPSRNVAEAAVGNVARRRPPATVFQDRGWRILELPSSGQYL